MSKQQKGKGTLAETQNRYENAFFQRGPHKRQIGSKKLETHIADATKGGTLAETQNRHENAFLQRGPHKRQIGSKK